MKTCSLCGQEKPIDAFKINRESKAGQPIYEGRCDPCRIRYRRMYGKRHKARLNGYSREYRRL